MKSYLDFDQLSRRIVIVMIPLLIISLCLLFWGIMIAVKDHQNPQYHRSARIEEANKIRYL
jgi:hypothetical protein